MLFTPTCVSTTQCGCLDWTSKTFMDTNQQKLSLKWHFTVLSGSIRLTICDLWNNWNYDRRKMHELSSTESVLHLNHNFHAKPLCNKPNNQNTFDYKLFVSQYWNSMLELHKNAWKINNSSERTPSLLFLL